MKSNHHGIKAGPDCEEVSSRRLDGSPNLHMCTANSEVKAWGLHCVLFVTVRRVLLLSGWFSCTCRLRAMPLDSESDERQHTVSYSLWPHGDLE